MSGPSVRSEFVDGLVRLDAAETRARLKTVKAAVDRRIDELQDPDLRLALLRVSDSVSRLLMETSRKAIERLAEGLAVSNGEAPARRPMLPSANPRR